MKLRHLGVFLSVCDAGNMTAAAEKLHMSQPSVSQAIAELEQHYQVKLFERLGRKLFITEAGKNLETYARHIVNLNKEAEESMREIHRRGSLRIGASTTVGASILADILVAFMREQPQAKLSSFVNNTKEIEELLLLDQLDIGLVEGKVNSPGILSEPFLREELVLVCGASHQLSTAKVVRPVELEQFDFVVREHGSGTRELFESVMASQGLHWKVYGVYNNVEAIKKVVAANLALSVMSRMVIAREVAAGELRIVSLKKMHFTRQFSIVHHKNKYRPPLFQRFIQLCRQTGING